jgi:hypothetical protein
MSNLPMVHPSTWQSHPVCIFTTNMVYIGRHSSGYLVPQCSDYNFTGKDHLMGAWEQSYDTENFQQLRQQILAMQKLMIVLFLQLMLQKLSWMNSRVSIHLTC